MTTTWIDTALQAKTKAEEAENQRHLAALERDRRNQEEGVAIKWNLFTSCLVTLLGADAASEILAAEHKVSHNTSPVRLKSTDMTINCGDPYVWVDGFKFEYATVNLNNKGEMVNPSFFIRHHEDKEWPENFEKYTRKTLRGTKISSAAQLGEAAEKMSKTYNDLVSAFPTWTAEQERRRAEEELQEVAFTWAGILEAIREHIEDKATERSLENENAETPKQVNNLSHEDLHGIVFLREIIRKIEDGETLRADEKAVWGVAVFTQSIDSGSDEYDY